ncbi:hypothetical protein EDC17_10028 [Sphingobacterium alimentarium]|uniref:Uncharacterized protein n=2 Tax=Sphingobacterium alimentarium TaxID=797292 RepID=A0A4R3VWL7_9SPHI|nr:hypothetical protein EDC17_10028 [Sphingobacterium alimentarium]
MVCTLTSCNNYTNQNKSEGTIDTSETSKLSDSVILIQHVHDWNNIYNTKNISLFQDLYADQVLLYGQSLYLRECIKNKNDFFNRFPDSRQQINGIITIDSIGEYAKCNFVKRVMINNKTTDYQSYLIFEKQDDIWKIVAESDLITDKNIAKTNSKVPDGSIKGDFNGDGKLDYVWAVSPILRDDEMSCFGECIVQIYFSDPNLSILKIHGINTSLENLGDLNNDGRDELGFQPAWFTSCWRKYYVKTWKNNKWEDLIEPIPTHCNQWEAGYFPIEKDLEKNNHVIVTYSFHSGNDIKTLKKSIFVD